MAERTEPESPPKGMRLLNAALTATVPAKASPKEALKLSGKAQTRGCSDFNGACKSFAEGTAEGRSDCDGAWEDDDSHKGSLEVKNGVCEGTDKGRADGACESADGVSEASDEGRADGD
jgi:hypothetical protein